MRWSARARAPRPATASAGSCAPASSTTRRSRSRCRPRAACRCSRFPGMPGAQMGAISIGDIFGKLGGGRTKTRARHRRRVPRYPDQRGIRQAPGQRPAGAGIDQGGRAERHRLSRRDRQDRRPRGPRRRRRVARGRAARPAAADRGHHRFDQARHGQDRPYPVHRVGRLPPVEAVGPAARAAGPAADPGRAARAHARRSPAHPDRARGVADQAIRGADGDRGRDARLHRRTRSTPSPTSRSR